MTYFLCDLVNYVKEDLWIEEHNIPFESKTYDKKKQETIYKNCFLYYDTADLIDKLPDNIEFLNLDEEISTIHGGNVYQIYSDGGSFNNGKKDKDKPVFGSMATIVTLNNKTELFNEGSAEEDATNNFCELNAGLKGLKFIFENYELNKNDIIIMNSDSQYLMKGINEWMAGWIRRGWKNNNGEKISNFESWQELYKLMKTIKNDYNVKVLTCWVRGHQSDNNSLVVEYNNKCDIICNEQLNILLEEHNLPTRKIKY